LSNFESAPWKDPKMSDAETTREDTQVPAPPADAAADAKRRRQLRAAAAAEAGYLLSMRAA
jgi:hypothetical protein